MKQIEVSREFLDEFENLKDMYISLYPALKEVAQWEGIDHHTNVYQRLFTGYFEVDNQKQLEFAEVWAGKAEYVVKEQLYYVRLIDHEEGYLYYDIADRVYHTGDKSENEFAKTKFTEEQIKDINPAYWDKAFLEPFEGKSSRF